MAHAESAITIATVNNGDMVVMQKLSLQYEQFTDKAISVANPTGQTKSPRPYEGAQFVAIPEFQGIGTQVGQTIAGTLSGQGTVEQGLKAAQAATERTIRQAGYPKK